MSEAIWTSGTSRSFGAGGGSDPSGGEVSSDLCRCVSREQRLQVEQRWNITGCHTPTVLPR